MTILTAKVATVKLGLIEIEGLLILETKEFAIAQQQTASLLSVIPTSAPKYIKDILGANSELFSVRTDRNVGTKQNKPEKALSLEQLRKVIVKAAEKGNEKAKVLRDLLVGLSLHQLFCDGFNIKFETEERQQWLIERMESKELFAELTTAIKETREAAGKEVTFFHYSTPADAINRGLFGKTAKQIREELGTPKQALNRDNFGRRSLRWITNVQESAARRVRTGQKPCEAIATVISELGYEVIDYRS